MIPVINKRLSRVLIALVASALHCFISSAQETDDILCKRLSDFAENLSPERLYLHTDREVYCVGDTIWFKGYLRNHSTVSTFPESNYIYVELISALSVINPQSGAEELSNQVRRRVKIKRTEDGFSGYIDIPDKLSSGPATIRAYTWWMRNQPEEQFFKKSIRLVNPVKEDYVAKLTAKKDMEQGHYLDMGVLNPFHKVRVKVKDIDVQFLPESGRYRYGVSSCVAVMITSDSGKGLAVSGEIRSGDTVLGTFRTNDVGMGKATITVPRGTKRLSAVVDHPAARSRSYKVPFPTEDAVTISVEPSLSSISLIASGLPSSAAWTVITDRNGIALTAPFEDGREYVIPCKDLMPGVNNALVLNKEGRIIAERDFFVYPLNGVKASFSTDKTHYGQNEKVNAGLCLSGAEGTPLAGDFSLSVFDSGWFPTSGSQHTLESYHYLGGEFHSQMENPARYFDSSVDIHTRIKELDLVMLTHGWKYYDIEAILQEQVKAPVYGREYSQSISGKVTRLLGIDAKHTTIAFMAPSIDYSTIESLDSTGHFVLEGMDFPNKTLFLISTTSERGGSTMPVIDEEKYPALGEMAFHSNNLEYIPETEIEEFKIANFPEIYGNDEIDAFTLHPSYIIGEAKRTIKGISPYPQFSFKPGQLQLYEEIQLYDNFSILDYIAMKVPGVRVENEMLVTRVGFSSSGMSYTPVYKSLIIYLNGMAVTESDYWMLSSMTIQDVDAIAVLRGSDAAKFQYNGNMRPTPVVLIKSKPVVRTQANIATVRPLGWQEPARFYIPKYGKKDGWDESDRYKGTSFWSPSVKIIDGKIDFSFWTSRHETEYQIVIEGYTDDGMPLSFSTVINGDNDE